MLKFLSDTMKIGYFSSFTIFFAMISKLWFLPAKLNSYMLISKYFQLIIINIVIILYFDEFY